MHFLLEIFKANITFIFIEYRLHILITGKIWDRAALYLKLGLELCTKIIHITHRIVHHYYIIKYLLTDLFGH